MADIMHFRSALNGFNREDVVHYIDYLNTTHENQVKQLQADLAAAAQEPEFVEVPQDNTEIENLREQCAQQETLLAAVNAEKEALMARCVQLEAALAAQKEAASAAQKEVPVVTSKAPISSCANEELAAYRRAERVEREATDRAQGIYRKLQALLCDAADQTNSAVDNLDSIAEQVNAQLAVLRESLRSNQCYLQQTADGLLELHPSQSEE